MPWWAWTLIAAIGALTVGTIGVLALAYTFTKGDNPDSEWPL